jgi:hypothetical protein
MLLGLFFQACSSATKSSGKRGSAQARDARLFCDNKLHNRRALSEK